MMQLGKKGSWEIGMVDVALQRKSMVESQVRTSDVTDRRILRAMSEVAREDFVPDALRSLAYSDGELCLVAAGGGQPARIMLPPRVMAKLLQLARLEGGDKVLIVGAASGYSAAVVARIAASVTALECDSSLVAAARAALARQSVANVRVVEGELAAGYPQDSPYDVIVLEGTIAVDLPGALCDQLRNGGRIAGVRDLGGGGKAVLWQKLQGQLSEAIGFDAAAPPLPGFGPKPAFVF
jgi:protein-L-isoaspartate(D-aspartate) O-methyltransferase